MPRLRNCTSRLGTARVSIAHALRENLVPLRMPTPTRAIDQQILNSLPRIALPRRRVMGAGLPGGNHTS
eukprot:3611269-Rhodomonas_salina.4